jgi:hypothetical protein
LPSESFGFLDFWLLFCLLIALSQGNDIQNVYLTFLFKTSEDITLRADKFGFQQIVLSAYLGGSERQ